MSRAYRRLREQPLLYAGGIVIGLACFMPLAWLVIAGIREADQAIAPVLAASSTLPIALRSLGLAVGVAALAVAISLPLAWLTHATNLPGRAAFRWLVVLPLAIPSYISGFVVVALLGPSGSLRGLASSLGIGLPDVYGTFGVVIALLFMFPLALLPLQAALEDLDASQWEAARGLGLSPWLAFRRVIWPQLRMPAANGGLLVALYVLSDFGAVSLLRYPTLSYVIYLRYENPFGRSESIGYALLLMLLVGILFGLHRWLAGRSSIPSRASTRRPWPSIPLGPWRWPAALVAGSVVGLGVLLPIASTLGWWLRGVAAGAPTFPVAKEAVWTLGLGLAAALIITSLAILPGLLTRAGSRRVSQLLRVASHSGYALPGIVVALALVFFATRVALPLYQTLPMLLIAYGVRFLPLAIQNVDAGLERQSRRLDDAARSLGRTQWRVWLEVTLPAAAPAIFAAGLTVFVSTIKELPATLLLAPLNTNTLATRIWGWTSEAYFTAAAAPALILVVLAFALLVVRPDRRRRTSP